MTEKQFDQMLASVILEFDDDDFAIPAEYFEPHVFSRRFERKMKKLLRTVEHSQQPKRRISLRRAVTIALIAAAFLSAAAITTGAMDNLFQYFLPEVFPTHSIVRSSNDTFAPTSFEEQYAPVYVAQGFELTRRPLVTENRAELSYTYEPCDGEGREISFRQWLKADYAPNLNTENHDLEPITVQGCEGFKLVIGEHVHIVWDNGDYVLEIYGIVSENELMKMAESVQKVEK